MIRLENVLKTYFQDVLQDVFKTSWKHLEDIFARRLEDVLKTSWKRLEDILRTFLQDVLKMFQWSLGNTSWRRLENVLTTSWRRMPKMNMLVLIKTSWRKLEHVWPRRIYWSWSRRLENVLKMSSEEVWVKRIYSPWWRHFEDVFWSRRRKTSSSRRMFAGLFLRTNIPTTYIKNVFSASAI